MNHSDVERSAAIAAGQAVEAVNVVQRRGVVSDDDRYRENLALAVSNLSIAVRQLSELLHRKGVI